MQIHSKLPHVGLTIFSTMSALANKHNAINLAQGFPNFKNDNALIDLVNNAMINNYNQYAPMPGVLSLREAIAEKFKFLYNSEYNPNSEITITAGATQAIFTAISAFINNGDEVIIFKPAYDCYEPAVTLHGGKVIALQLKAPHYKIDWEEVRTKVSNRTKMIIINSPHNPSGTIFDESDMLTLQDITMNTNIIVLSDEVYEHIVFDNNKHQSLCLFSDLKSRGLITASFGKTFHNTGWKVGYICGPQSLMSEFRKVHQFNVFSVNHPVQIALTQYLKNKENYLSLPNFFQKKRDLFINLIKNSRFKLIPSSGTYFQCLQFSDITEKSDFDFAKYLTIEHGLASIPMSVFNEIGVDFKILRFCFAKTDDTLIKAAEIINKI